MIEPPRILPTRRLVAMLTLAICALATAPAVAQSGTSRLTVRLESVVVLRGPVATFEFTSQSSGDRTGSAGSAAASARTILRWRTATAGPAGWLDARLRQPGATTAHAPQPGLSIGELTICVFDAVPAGGDAPGTDASSRCSFVLSGQSHDAPGVLIIEHY